MSVWKKVSAVLCALCLLQTLWLLSLSNREDTGPDKGCEQKPLSYLPNKTLWHYYKQLIVSPHEDVTNERLTLVMPTYKREDILPAVTKHYCSMGDSIERILIVWNDVRTPIPPSLLSLKCEIEMMFLVSKENKLTNRFLPRKEILTRGL